MANFAEIDENNVVLRVLHVDNEHEHRGPDYLAVDLGLGGTWIQTSYNGNFRGKLAGIGDIYYPELDLFGIAEAGLTEYLKIWNGYNVPTSPSLFVDSAPRSGNVYLNVLLNRAFNFNYQRWGYMSHHNPEGFLPASAKFDLIVSPIRLPINILASWINMSKDIEERVAVNYKIDLCIDMYKKVLENKDNIMIVEFEDFIADPNALIAAIENRLSLSSNTVDLEEVESFIRTLNDNYDNFYSMPIENRDEIDSIKPILLSDEEYGPKIATLTSLYNQLSEFKVNLAS